ncbi:MAG: DUF3526 domain-containing protein [Ferruginibacter sp.]
MKNNTNFTDKPTGLLKTQYWLFTKQKSNFILLLVFLLAGFYGLYQGYTFKQKQTSTINTFRSDKIKNLTELIKGFDADTSKPAGKAAYEKVSGLLSSNWNTILPAYKMPNSTAIFAIGQGDVFPYYYTIKLESFFMQLFKQGEISNPLRSLSGHFDTSFWIIFLLPLLIIVLCFNTLAAELDNGNWRLINSQGITAKTWLDTKYLLIAISIEILLTAICLTGILINYFHFNQLPSTTDFLFFIGANLYFVFWLTILYFINSLGKNTSYNALCSGMVWTMLCIVLPTLTTMVIEKTIAVDNTKISRMSRRPQGSKFEDTTFGIKIIQQYVVSRPQYKNNILSPSNPAFSFAVYNTFHELMDDSNTVTVNIYFTAIERRQQYTNLSTLINPAAALDGNFDRLAENDAVGNHQFIWQTKAFHKALHEAYFPALFFDGQLTKKRYADFPVFTTQNYSAISTTFFLNFLLLAAISWLLYFIGSRNLEKL